MRPIRAVVFGDEIGIPVVRETLNQTDIELKAEVYSGRRFPKLRFPKGDGRRLILGGEYGYAQENLAHILRDLEIDLLLCYSFDQILRKEILELSHLGAWNLHGGKLPGYRGANVLNWVLINGETETAMTMHEMVAEVDAGAILAEEIVPVGEHDDAVVLRDRLVAASYRVLEEGITRIVSGQLKLRQQDVTQARIYPRRTPADGYIDWTKSDLELYNLIRGLVAPWPGAYFFAPSGDKIIIDRFLTMEEVHQARIEFQPKL